jgi:cell division protein FtsB
MGVSNIVSKTMEAKMIMKNYVADELSNKVYHLHKALEQAQDIIKVLETENNNLKEAIKHLEEKTELVAA